MWAGLPALALLTGKKCPHLEAESSHLDPEPAAPGEELNKHPRAYVCVCTPLLLAANGSLALPPTNPWRRRQCDRTYRESAQWTQGSHTSVQCLVAGSFPQSVLGWCYDCLVKPCPSYTTTSPAVSSTSGFTENTGREPLLLHGTRSVPTGAAKGKTWWETSYCRLWLKTFSSPFPPSLPHLFLPSFSPSFLLPFLPLFSSHQRFFCIY